MAVQQHIAAFADRWVNGELPGWLVMLFCINELVMPIKERPPPGATPDCRPVACPDPLRRAIESAEQDVAAGDYAVAAGDLVAPATHELTVTGTSAEIDPRCQH